MHHPRLGLPNFSLGLKWLPGLLFLCVNAVAADAPNPTIQSLADLQNLAGANYQVIASFSVSGVVCAADNQSGLVALQDDSGTVLLKLPSLDPGVRPGDSLALKATQTTL